MANWCKNIVEFEGSEQALKEVEKLFHSLKHKEEATTHGQLPDFVRSDTGYLFNINWEDAVLTFETKWVPNIEVIKKVAEHFGISYLHSYYELGCLVFGEALYQNGVFSTVDLDPADFDLYQTNPENEDTWIFEGQVYESDFEILEVLLERKKENSNQSKN